MPSPCSPHSPSPRSHSPLSTPARDGTIGDAEIATSLRDDFDAYTVETLRQWTFEPATLDGEAVRVHYNLTVNYELDGSKSGDT